MLSDRLIKSLSIRVKLGALLRMGLYDWDTDGQHLTNSGIYVRLNMFQCFLCGWIFSIAHGYQIYLKLTTEEIPEEGNTGEGTTEFGTIIIGWGDMSLVACVTILNGVTMRKRNLLKYMVNEMLAYNKLLREMELSGKITVPKEHKFIRKWAEYLLEFLFWASLFLPLGIAMAFTHPIEATNVILKEWFEIHFRFAFTRSNMMVLTVASVLAYVGGNIVCMITLPIIFFYLTSTICVDGFTPVKIQPKHNHRCKVKTTSYGELTDDEVIRLYRHMQMFNILMGDFFKSVFVSFHHIALLVTECILLTFAIRFEYILAENGIAAYFVVGYCIFLPLFLIYTQSKMGGQVVDTSNAFKEKGFKIIPRRFILRKFVASCQTFYIQVAYPFYTIHKETFLMFAGQVLDNVVNLLVW